MVTQTKHLQSRRENHVNLPSRAIKTPILSWKGAVSRMIGLICRPKKLPQGTPAGRLLWDKARSLSSEEVVWVLCGDLALFQAWSPTFSSGSLCSWSNRPLILASIFLENERNLGNSRVSIHFYVVQMAECWETSTPRLTTALPFFERQVNISNHTCVNVKILKRKKIADLERGHFSLHGYAHVYS